MFAVACVPSDSTEEGTSSSTGDPVVTDTATSAIHSADNNGCGLNRDGTVTCWGFDERGVLDVPDGVFTSLTGGQDYACALDEEGAVVCWGNPTDWGELAHGLPDDPYGLLDVPDGTFVQVDGGDTHICALRASGAVVCWGSDTSGKATPPDGIQFKWISAGHSATLGVDVQGHVHSWGVLGPLRSFEDDPPTGRFTQVSAGWEYGCGIKEDTTVECWDPTYDPDLPEGTGWTWISVGFWHGCAIRDEAELYCFGRESWGEVDLDRGPSPPPTKSYEQVSADMWTTCARRRAGGFDCWGNDTYGQVSPP